MVHKDIYQALERMRKQKGLTEKALCEGIISERTYRRYLYQESEIPFFILSELTNRMHIDVYEFLYDVTNVINSSSQDEIRLLDLLITDRFDEANTMLETMTPPFKSAPSQFLLPLMLLRLDAVNGILPTQEVDDKMKQALNLQALFNMSFITVDHVKLIEHLFLTFDDHELELTMTILKRVISKEIHLIHPSDYSMMKCHQMYIHGLIISQANIIDIKNAFIHAVTYSYEYGGMMIIDELMILMREHGIDQQDDTIKRLMESFYIPAAFMYHMNDINDEEDDMNYLKSVGKDSVVKPIYLKNEVFK